MARNKPDTAGGKALSAELITFIKGNIEEMKNSKSDASVNETLGIEDTANAIAYAIEKVLGGAKIITPGPASTLLSAAPGSPVAGTYDLSIANPKYSFK